MKRALLSCLFLIVAMTLAAQWQWASQAGGMAADQAFGVAADNDGNTYIAGYFYGGCMFGPISPPSSGSYDIFVAKYDNEGNVLWVTPAGGSDLDKATDIVLDSAGNIYITGDFEGTASFGDKSVISAGGKDVFVAKLSSSGYWLWVTTGGGQGIDTTSSMALDENSNIYIAGLIGGVANFGAYSPYTFGAKDILVAKLDSDGNWLWAKSAGGSYDDTCQRLAYDSRGLLVLSGQISGNVSFGAGQNHGSNTGICGFLAKMSLSGNWVWAERIVSTHWIDIKGLALDSYGNIYLSGLFGTDWSIDSFTLTGDTWGDCFLAKFDDQSANCLWANRAGNNSDDYGGPIAIKSTGQVYWAGYFVGELQLGPFTVPYTSSGDIFIARLSPDGEYEMAQHVGGICEDFPNAMILDSQERICLAGGYTGEMYFDDIHLPWSNSVNIYVGRLYDLPVIVGVNDLYSPELSGISSYPNPFSASTHIAYELKYPASSLELNVYNLRGQLIRKLSDAPANPGKHAVIWDGNDNTGIRVAAGIYYYQLQTKDERRVGKTVLVD